MLKLNQDLGDKFLFEAYREKRETDKMLSTYTIATVLQKKT